jgi:7-cyano-7-deazaguanine tRNA-ribosyltransferase
MSFEIREKDLLGRIGRLKTKSSTVETPLLLPVVNPAVQPIPPRRIREEFGFEALITNAYILKQRFQDQPVREGLHRFLDFDGAIMTDSGAYQILVYGDIKTNPKEIIRYQEQINTDIATILDIPTGWRITEEHAKRTVRETLNRARQLFKTKTRDNILWVGPVQGGRYLDLVAKSAQETGRLPFDIHALGSPTEVMERYRFDVLAEMIITAKMNLPFDRPLHLFGGGHPFMFALAVALGCDLFDSAAYALYAREDRYMTENGTYRLNELDYFPCACPKCSHSTPKRASELEQDQRTTFLAEHNLYVCSAEMKRVKQAMRDGRLWEHLEMRAHAHPALLQALKTLPRYEEFIEKHSPITKKSGLFFFNSIGLMRPEVVHHRKMLEQRYANPKEATTLLLVPQTETKPFHKSKEYKKILRNLKHQKHETGQIHTCFYAAPFGVIPIELDEVYPLSQHETVVPPDRETAEYVANQIVDYINRTSYSTVILINDEENWKKTILNACKNACRRKKINFKTFNVEKVPPGSSLSPDMNDESTRSKPEQR